MAPHYITPRRLKPAPAWGILMGMKARLAILLVAAVFLGACSDDPAGPDDSGTGGDVDRLPLAVGSAWTYDLTFDVTWTYDDGTEANPPEHIEGTGTREIIGTETIDGRDYVTEAFFASSDGGPPRAAWRRFRQADGALYQADVATSLPPNKVPDEEFGESVRLRFPLAAGETWQLRPGSAAVIVTVEARETLSLPVGETSAWRVRVEAASAGPDDYRLLWYSRDGLVRLENHAEVHASDITSGRTVLIVTHEVQVLTEVDLAR